MKNADAVLSNVSHKAGVARQRGDRFDRDTAARPASEGRPEIERTKVHVRNCRQHLEGWSLAVGTLGGICHVNIEARAVEMSQDQRVNERVGAWCFRGTEEQDACFLWQ